MMDEINGLYKKICLYIYMCVYVYIYINICKYNSTSENKLSRLKEQKLLLKRDSVTLLLVKSYFHLLKSVSFLRETNIKHNVRITLHSINVNIDLYICKLSEVDRLSAQQVHTSHMYLIFKRKHIHFRIKIHSSFFRDIFCRL